VQTRGWGDGKNFFPCCADLPGSGWGNGKNLVLCRLVGRDMERTSFHVVVNFFPCCADLPGSGWGNGKKLVLCRLLAPEV